MGAYNPRTKKSGVGAKTQMLSEHTYTGPIQAKKMVGGCLHGDGHLVGTIVYMLYGMN